MDKAAVTGSSIVSARMSITSKTTLTTKLSSQQRDKSQFACLYTKHKTQKVKCWHDGRLVVHGGCAILFQAQPPPGSADPVLDECEITSSQQQLIQQGHETQLESERFLIHIEGPWIPPSHSCASTTSHERRTAVSSSMKKLMQRKFQRPTRYVPPPPHARPNKLEAALGKRRRPLQPGELEAMHYGSCAASPVFPVRAPTGNSSSFLHHEQAPPPNRHSDPWQGPSQRAGQFLSDQPLQDGLQQTPSTGYMNHPQPPPQEQPVYAVPEGFTLQTAFKGTIERTSEVRSQRQGTLQFMRNDFNASGYYGFEDEEEEDEGGCYNPSTLKHHSWDCSPLDQLHAATPKVSDMDVHKYANGNANMNTASTTEGGRQGQPSPFLLSTSGNLPSEGPQQEHHAKQSYARSTSELMALFGAGPTAMLSSCGGSSTPHGKENAFPRTETIETNEGNLPRHVQAATQHKNGGSFQVQFFLPTPTSSSSSSSDEEE